MGSRTTRSRTDRRRGSSLPAHHRRVRARFPVTSSHAPDSLLAACRALAARGAWEDVCAKLRPRLAETRALPALATMFTEALLRSRNPREARAWLCECESDLVLAGDRAAIRRAANLSGAANLELGELAEATSAFERALELARDDGDDLLIARATNNLAVIANIQGRHEEALRLYAHALPAYQRLGNAKGLAESYHNMAITFRDLRQLDSADEHEQRALEFARQAANAELVGMALVGRAELSFRRGDVALAEATASRVARDLSDGRDIARQGDALRLCGAARLAMGKLEAAGVVLDQAVQLASDHGNALLEAESRCVRAELGERIGELRAALNDAQVAVEIFTRLAAGADREAAAARVARLRRLLDGAA